MRRGLDGFRPGRPLTGMRLPHFRRRRTAAARSRPCLALLALLLVACEASETRPLVGFEVLSTALDFGRVEVADRAERAITVQNPTAQALEVQVRLEGDPAFALPRGTVAVAPRSTAPIDVTFLPPAEAVFTGAARLRAAGATRQVSLSGRGLASAWRWSTDGLDFGSVLLGATRQEVVTATNQTDRPRQPAFQGLEGCDERPAGPFCRAGGDGAVEPGEATSVTVRYAPVAVGTDHASLELGNARLTVTGEGVDDAVSCGAELDFGAVNAGRCLTRALRCVSVLTTEIQLRWVDPTDGLSVVGPVGRRVAAGEPFDIPVEYCAGAEAEAARLDVLATLPDGSPRGARVTVRGRPGGADVAADTTTIAAGLIGIGFPRSFEWTVRNRGVEPLLLRAVLPGPADLRVQAPAAVAPGDSVALQVTVDPTETGARVARLELETNDADTPVVRLVVTYEGVSAAPCRLSVRPQLAFGHVPLFTVTTREIEVASLSGTPCLVYGAALAGSGAFVAVGPWARATLLPPLGRLVLTVALRPTAAGRFEGEASLEAAAVESPLRVGVSGSARADAPVVYPNQVDFGTRRLGCGSRATSVRLYMPADVRLVQAELVGDPGFGVESPPLPSGAAAVELEVDFTPQNPGPARAELRLRFDPPRPDPVHVPLRARVHDSAPHAETFVQQDRAAADVLMVIDRSCSFGEEIQWLGARAETLLDVADAAGLDYRVAVTLPNDSDDSRLCPLGVAPPVERIISPQTPRGADLLTNHIISCRNLDGGAAFPRRFIEASLRVFETSRLQGANRPLMRPDASLTTVWLATDVDQSRGTVRSFMDRLLRFKGWARRNDVSAVLIGGPPDVFCTGGEGAFAGPHPRLHEALARVGGSAWDACALGSIDAERLAAAVLNERDTFVLATEATAGTVEVDIDGVPVPSTDWRYKASPVPAIRLLSPTRPAPGRRIGVAYRPVCR